MTHLRKCTVCGEQTFGPRMGAQKLREVIVRVAAELKQEPPHPVPPKVRTWEDLEHYEVCFHAGVRGRIEAVLEQVIEPDVEGICWDCSHARRMASYDRNSRKLDEELAELRAATAKP